MEDGFPPDTPQRPGSDQPSQEQGNNMDPSRRSPYATPARTEPSPVQQQNQQRNGNWPPFQFLNARDLPFEDPNPAATALTNPWPLPASFDRPIPMSIGIGRQVPPFGPPWECIFVAGSPPTFCGSKFNSDAELFNHYCQEHVVMRSDGLHTFFICVGCQMWNDSLGYCLQCGFVEHNRMEWWLVGCPIEDGMSHMQQNEDGIDGDAIMRNLGFDPNMFNGNNNNQDLIGQAPGGGPIAPQFAGPPSSLFSHLRPR